MCCSILRLRKPAQPAQWHLAFLGATQASVYAVIQQDPH